jgi:hypothetical protein
MTEIENLIEHFERELDYLKDKSGDKTFAELFIKLLKLFNKEDNVSIIKKFLSFSINSINAKVLSPLTLKEGEFIYSKPGLSINRRNDNICMDTNGIFNKEGYKTNCIIGYSSFTGETLDITDLKPYKYNVSKVYLIAGKYITPVYFDRCYLKQKDIDKGNYIPPMPIILPTTIIANSNTGEYIKTIRKDNPKLLQLTSMYNLRVEEDIDKNLENFNINFNYTKNAVYCEERSTFRL